MEGIGGLCSTKFFLPFGRVEYLEYHVEVLMNNFNIGYSSIMAIPVDRRYRIVDRIEEEFRKRANKNK